jgi:hypothetical protein
VVQLWKKHAGADKMGGGEEEDKKKAMRQKHDLIPLLKRRR